MVDSTDISLPLIVSRQLGFLMTPEKVLDEIGMSIAGEQPVISNFQIAGKLYKHHKRAVVAAIGYSFVDQQFARSCFPDRTLESIVVARSSLDDHEVSAIALLAGLQIDLPFWNEAQFTNVIQTIIAKYGLAHFFYAVDSSGMPLSLEHIRPRGFGPNGSECEHDVLAQWRSDYRALPAEKQIICATIVWLYQGMPDVIWLKWQPHRWKCTDAIKVLIQSGAYRDWTLLFACYSGW